MLFTDDRDKLRQFYVDVWRKHNDQQAMEPLETVVANVIIQHPEYHKHLGDGDAALAQEFAPQQGETNPFLHMGLHLAIQEQLNTQRPIELAQAYQRLMTKVNDAHEVEHRIMDCLLEMIWSAQHNNGMPDEKRYCDCLNRLA